MFVIEPKRKSILDWLFPLLGSLVILYLSLHLAVSYDVAKENPITRPVDAEQGIVDKEYFNSTEMFTNFGKRLENNADEIIFTESTPKFIGFSLLICFIMWGYIIVSRKKLISGKEYGTAEWATAKSIARLWAKNIAKVEIKNIKKKKGLNAGDKKNQIKEVKEKYENADMLLTKTEKVCMYNYELNNNTLIIGGSGSGKTRGYVMPNLLQAHSSFIITDPKGEVLEKSGHFLKNVQGYKLRVLNLDEKTLSNGYNPLHYIHREREGWEERVLTLIETIIVNTDGGEKKQSNDPFWDKAERLFLQSIFFAVVEAFPPEQSNMNTVVELIRWLKIKEDEDNYDSDLDIFFQCFEDKYGVDHIAVQQFKEFREKASGKTAKSIVISAVARLAPFKVKEVKRIFSYDDMQLGMVGEEKTAIFVIVPPVDSTYNFIAGMLFTQLFQELNYCALNVHKHDGQRLPVPCRFILDEFANTCTIPNFVRILAYARSLGIGITTVLQSLDQIKNLYKDEWGIIIDNSDTMLYLGKVKHMDTLEYLSKLLGKGTYDKKSSSRTKGRQSSTSVSNDRLGRELMDASEIGKLKTSKCLLFVGGSNPFYSTKYNYKNHKNYKFTSDGNKKFTFTYKPSPPPIFDVPHGEEVKQHEPPNVSLQEIQVEYGQEIVSNYLNGHMLNVDFDNDELYFINDGEHDELSLYAELDREDNDIKNTMDSILGNVVQMKTDSKSVVKASLDLIKAEIDEPNSVDFDSVEVNDGGPSEVDDYDIANDDVVAIDDVITDLSDLEEDMSDFLEQLNDIDIDTLTDNEDSTSISA